jgi:multicomponent K+:H+ antiporter subunit D
MTLHLAILPILIPLLGGLLMLLPPFAGVEKYQYRRVGALSLMLAQLACAIYLMFVVAQNGAIMYAVGDWQPPFGIIFYVDQLSALLVTLTAFLGLGVTLFSSPHSVSATRHIWCISNQRLIQPICIF